MLLANLARAVRTTTRAAATAARTATHAAAAILAAAGRALGAWLTAPPGASYTDYDHPLGCPADTPSPLVRALGIVGAQRLLALALRRAGLTPYFAKYVEIVACDLTADRGRRVVYVALGRALLFGGAQHAVLAALGRLTRGWLGVWWFAEALWMVGFWVWSAEREMEAREAERAEAGRRAKEEAGRGRRGGGRRGPRRQGRGRRG